MTEKKADAATVKNVAVVGAGYWGKNLVRNFNDLGALAVVCDPDAARLAEMTKPLAGVRALTKVEDVLRDKEIAAVAIAAPAETHANLV
jgi:UDP-2-acetamido-3-amino-2,3-dideoxy-glucuronate N-acetyltransferase